ncbi:ribonuclease HII [Arthrobacter silviterrae]|uniref:Ribonuclease HII n=1 Tax=Arthrobacter silviterrae TaxID=2026658 RepID=A0ABX0D840_9MICC|nr:ribonuclease HII [Arthrobacter silviterrae]MDQ0276794.1 ribonuclease HII [Arthrobacter silviterrae]NGN83069.1 ribonuclease HII [Arthrobacter silviterrae]
MASAAPTLEWERELAGQGWTLVAGCDEVGRGALAGPVSVGLVVIEAAKAQELPGVKDSKLLREPVREALVPAIREWAPASAVGHAAASEIDGLGLVAALRLAGTRALAQVAAELLPDFVILDGNQDWLSVPVQADLFSTGAATGAGAPMAVRTRIKADMTCLSVAAASVLAKVERDSMMVGLARDFPQFGWDANKGYATAAHRSAIALHGPTELHRRTWRLV